MKMTILLLTMLALAFGSSAEELPNEDWVKKELEKTSCDNGNIPTYKFTHLNPVRSYFLKDGELVLRTSNASCPEGQHYTGSWCAEVLCTKPEPKQAE